jgi:hypothetical protein
MMSNKEHYAIVIGINDYPLSGLAPLKGPVNDANDFTAWLSDPEGGNLPSKNIWRLVSSDAADGVYPHPNHVEALFEPFIVNGVQGQCGERLYIFAAGHGFGDPSDMGKTALYAANAKRMFPWHIAITNYAEWLRRHAVFEEIILIMDCCRTINSYHEIREPQYVVSSGNPAADRVRYFYAFAAPRGKEARERSFEDGRSSGIFTRTLLNALRKARPEQGRVTGQVVKNHIHNSLDHFAGSARAVVEPPEIKLDSHRDITFLHRKTPGSQAIQVVVQPPYEHSTLVLFDGNFREIRQEQTSSSTLVLDLEPGLYKIALKDSTRQRIFEVPNHEYITV